MWLVDFGCLFIVWLIAGLWLEEAGHVRVVYVGLFEENWQFVPVFFEDGLVMGLFMLLECPEMGGSYCSDGPGMG